jgi:ectoine hydroxylase-related dioxygenase (phytanoyl-CoA dioxygenase family)
VPPGLVESFRRDGFVVVPDLLEPQELAHFGKCVDAAVEARQRRRRPLEERSRYEQSFLQSINLWEDHPDVRALSFHPRVTGAAACLLGVEALRLWHDQALYKEPGGRETDAHQDQPYWPMREADALTAWIPFDDVRDESGRMGYVPGSHRLGLRRFVNIFLGEPEDVLARPELAGREPVFVDVPRGAVAFHHSLTVHCAKPNRSERMRRVHTMIFFRDGATRGSEKHPHPCVDRAGLREGEPIASDVTPIAWPRPDGSLPPRPSHPMPKDAFSRHVWPE